MTKVLGIDLGTTNSCASIMEAGSPQVIANREGSRTTSSIVGFTEDGDRLVGQIAKRQAITNPQNTIFAVKRLIGRKYASDEVQRARQVLPYSVINAQNGDLKIQVRDKEHSPEEISAFILQEIKAFADEAMGQGFTEAVITVPAYFNDSQRQATRDAGRIAGLEVLRIINEPTAAALAYGIERREGIKTIAVYDLGGGTFDISILELNEGVFEVKSTAGDTYLGGEDFDQRIMDWLIEEFLGETGVDLRSDRMALQRLKEAAERAKCEVSSSEQAPINLPFISADASGPRHLSRTLSRQKFEQLVGDLVTKTEGPCRDALEQARLRPDQIDEVLLVGGQTRSPIVIETVKRIFGREPNREINPDEVVAIGAGIQGGILKGEVKDIVLLDVTPLSLGIETHGGLFTRLIDRNSTIPTKVTQIFTTVSDNQDTVEIHCLQGEREIASENRSLGRFEMGGIPPAPRGVPQIEVTFAIDSNGIVNVSSRDMATNQSQSIQISPAGGLSKEEVERLVDEARTHASDDADRRELRRHKNRLEGLIYTCDRVFEQLREGMEGQEQKKIAQIVLKARMSLSQDEKADIEAAIFDLNTISHRLSELMLEQTTKAKEKEAKEKEKEKGKKDKEKDKEREKEKGKA
ncbi:MAG TPA: molecular chaperone DnaK [Thermoanaerobaculia bacterium]|nr:molecular chaperone DnaK [Thermoanaerobaculia bacterium]